MTDRDPDAHVRRLASESLASGEPTAWFDQLYVAAHDGEAVVPWDRGAPHPLFAEWTRHGDVNGQGKRAMVVGCGLGEDAEHVAALGFDTVAFDVSTAAIRSARQRFPGSRVGYFTADLLHPPAHWRDGFDLVVEIFTVQSLPERYHQEASRAISRMVAPGGTLIVIATARDDADHPDEGPPWPLTRFEINEFATNGLEPVRIENLLVDGNPDGRRWRAEFFRWHGLEK